MSSNGCNHVNTEMRRDGNDSIIVCTAAGCGAEVSRAKDVYKDKDD